MEQYKEIIETLTQKDNDFDDTARKYFEDKVRDELGDLYDDNMVKYTIDSCRDKAQEEAVKDLAEQCPECKKWFPDGVINNVQENPKFDGWCEACIEEYENTARNAEPTQVKKIFT